MPGRSAKLPSRHDPSPDNLSAVLPAWLPSLRELLNADLVRRVALPLRQRNPRLYALLNRRRQRLLTGSGEVAAYQANALAHFRRHARLEGARVLEIASDLELRVLRRLLALGASEAVGVNNSPAFWSGSNEREIVVGGARLLDADATSLPFAAASFDAVFSVAGFEHILDLPAALAEIHRVLVPGGRAFASFGPIWSGCKGHHLSVSLDGEELRHFQPESNPLPDFSHLLLDAEQMRAALAQRVDAKWIEVIIDYVYFGSAINRLFHHQYVEIFERSPLRTVSLRAERDPIHPQLRRVLELRHPAEADFAATNCEVVLEKAVG